MGLKRNVSLTTALRYKGEGPYLAFILHRIGGVALFIFFSLYILILAGVDSANSIFSNWIFQIIILIFGLFHAINGLRITIMDLSPKMFAHYQKAISIEWVLYALLCGFILFVVLQNRFGG
ncbi:MAG: hypothetical protein QGM50_01235 [Anaerolineae bacterium]|nr:hypothetical protein [SAR324 cluster bacterium]MDK1028635.1 hypothetical protein [Anaerolineae bacterium]MDK1080826.1 hypothetical protein [Anaerolineae bacterium]MDK1117390.1 hypothetical protein [Anaerolineae bacterium]